ncbi:hypothetical protein COLINT_01971 [Collinsella intestinalis DSM 13280]|uniref:Uncharacterized protein n=1 Tax=Collinsella intestinalis DSM 13280 TaxID=521003 RepID=C4F7F7_9ACTN|nr:hypothetical protein COLINT_01971 [Collinsella intestinalis DSM 13280]
MDAPLHVDGYMGSKYLGGGDCQRPFMRAWGVCRSFGLAF